ncbi:hypothetical protein [Marinicella sp. W31]|uniref:hypothetical protein n=1 Tax=Marinicella sp. W31 TaxID=3023713 RepID=UPI003757E976
MPTDWSSSNMMMRCLCLLIFSFQVLALPGIASLNQCPDVIFNDAFENNSSPSLGTGGGFPGDQNIAINIPKIGIRTYYLYVPDGYQASEAWPLLVLWHGQVVPGQADTEAQNIRNFWQQTAEANNIIILAQASSGAGGGWLPGTDSQILAAMIDDVQSLYNIENNRIYGWGFSAGAHVMHAIALNNTDFFAGYAASAGTLSNFAGTAVLEAAPRKIAAFVSVGTQDPLFSDAQAESLLFQQAGWVLGRNYWLDAFNGGHQLNNDLPEKAWQAICTATLLDE